ncbi:nucleolin 2-like [Daucus carota subsp. sativus]|uniref:nucleolin 2-like n=1 Tax=Daucus carota subsp. sativus TaxID=79200 RepID=UPI0030834958
MQQFLAQSAIATALTAPARLSGSQIINFWRTGKYDNGGEDGSPLDMLQSKKKTKSDKTANSDAVNSDPINTDPLNTEAASPQKQKRRRLVAAYDYDDLEPAHAVNSEPIPTTDTEPVQTSPQQKPARFKRRAQKPARAKDAIVHDTAPENYKSDVVDESDKVALEALQSLAKAGEEPSKSQFKTQEKSAQDTVEKVADPASDNDEDDESSDDDNDENDTEVPQSHLQQKWESTSHSAAGP